MIHDKVVYVHIHAVGVDGDDAIWLYAWQQVAADSATMPTCLARVASSWA